MIRFALLLASLVPTPALRSDGLLGHWVVVEVTAYCPCRLCCGRGAHGVTANGTRVSEVPYGIAAPLDLMPAGTRVLIPHGYGYLDRLRPDDRVFTVDDTGGDIRARTAATGRLHLDLRCRDHWWAVEFGRKTISVFVLTP